MYRLLWMSSALILLLLLCLGPSLQAVSRRLPKVDCSCPSEGEMCNCALKGITSVSSEALKNCSTNWTKIDFSFNRIDTLNPPGQFAGFNCNRVETLYIFHNIINGSIQTGTFEGLPNLLNLNLSRNAIRVLKGEPFSSCPKLRVIDLSSNHIRVIPKTAFNGVKDVEFLNLFGNFIGYIEKRAFALRKLTRLILAQNNITQLQGEMFYGLTNLMELDLVRNPLKEIEAGLFQQTPNLLRLNLGLCGKLGGLREIRTGIFSGLPKLDDLNVTGCHILKIEVGAFAGLDSLRRLSLRRNKLVRIDRGLWKPLETLQSLDLSENQIRCMTDFNFDNLKSLETLILANNRVTYLSEGAFRGLSKLKTLVLDSNPFRIVQIDIFCSLTVLSNLSLKDVVVHHIIATDRKNSSLQEAVASLPKSLSVSSDDNSLRGRGIGCRAPLAPVTPDIGNATCSVYLDSGLYPNKPNSRQYLLIIIGVCVSFLLMAMAVILCYRAWSKRKRTACEKAEQAALEEEKQEMMEKPSGTNAQVTEGNATTELLAAGQSAENGVVLHHTGAAKEGQTESAQKEEENTMTHLAVV